MKYHTIEVNGKEYNFRLTADEMEQLEKRTGTKLLDYIGDYSVTTTINLLQKMWKKDDGTKATHEEAQELFEELADEGYGLKEVAQKIIWEGCVVSGLLTKSDLELALKNGQQATQN